MLKRSLALLLSLTFLLALLPSAALAAVSGFTDVPEDAYYADAVRWAVAEGVTNGTSAATFSPDSTVTRGQAVTFLWRAMGRPEPTAQGCAFRDVARSDYFFKPVLWAVEQGVTNGTSADAFSPDQICSRAHILTFLYRTVGEPGKTGRGEWYSDALTWADRAGIARREASGSPVTDCPRAEVVYYLWKYGGDAAADSLADALIDRSASVRHDNGDIVFSKAGELLTDDEGASFPYYSGLLTVYLREKPTEEVLRRLPALVGGELVSYLNGTLRVLEIRVPAEDRASLEALAEILQADSAVLYAGLSVALEMNDAKAEPGIAPDDPTPWFGEGNRRGDEANPGGNDWWAEAIGAYTAWQYEDLSAMPMAGVIDSGFQMDHTELKGRTISLPGYAIGGTGEHGTGVTSIIAANKTTGEMRGVADRAVVVCFHRNEPTGMYYRGLEFLEVYQKMFELGVFAINHSFDYVKPSFQDYLKENGLTDLYQHGDAETKAHIEELHRQKLQMIDDQVGITATNCLWMIFQMLQSGGDCLFVQSAGNKSCEASESGFFSGVTEELFDRLFSDPEGQALLRETGISYNDIRFHIMIVGAVRPDSSSSTGYRMTDYSCYGDAVTIVAPGGDDHSKIYCADTYNNYQWQTGTSLAAPMVTGAAALLKSMDPSLTAQEIWGILMKTAVSVPGTDPVSRAYPMLRVGEAVRYIAGLLKIKVLDGDGKPIGNAEITLTDRTGHVLTAKPVYGEDGKTPLYYSVPALKDKNGSVCRIEIAAEGYGLMTETLTVTGDAELEYGMADRYERDRRIYTEYLLNGGYEEIIEGNGWLNRAGVKSSKTVVKSCMADLDGDGVHELLISLEDRSSEGIRGWHTVSAVLGIGDDDTVRLLLTAFNGGGSMGGEFLRPAYDTQAERYYPVVSYWYQDSPGRTIRGDVVWTGSAASYSVGFDLKKERIALSGNSVTDQYLLQRINEIKGRTSLYEYVDEYGSSVFCCYTLDDAFISRAQYDAQVQRYTGLGDYQEPSDPAYQFRTCSWRDPIAARDAA